MPGPTPLPVRLTDKQRAELLLLREDDNSRLRARATIIMACAEGLSNNEVARRENTTPATVARWRRAFCGDGCRGLRDAPRAGRPRVGVELSDDEREALLRYQRRVRRYSDLAIGEIARAALEAGVTYIGNMSQFGWKYPAWPGDDVEQVAETIKALGLMASKIEDDVVLHSYLDDGYCAQFKDYCSYVGWALLESYLINDVIGARVAIAYGGLTHNPMTKAAMILALESVKPSGTHSPFYHGNTTAYGDDLDPNFAVLSLDVLYIMLAQLHTGSATPTLPIPVTEALRIPSWEEIVQAHTIARRIANDAERLMVAIDWPRIEQSRDELVAGGRQFYDNLMNGFSDLGVDLEDPMQMLLLIRRLGGAELERRFGVGERPKDDNETYRPVVPTDTFEDFLASRGQVRETFRTIEPKPVLTGRPIVGSTDIHEYAMLLLVDALDALGLEPIVAGTSVDPDEFADLALEAGATTILVSTHNGMALTYARELLRELEKRSLSIPVAIGGTLNQDIEGVATPVDVGDELTRMGVNVCRSITDMLDVLQVGTK